MTADLRLGRFDAVGNPGTTISLTLTFVNSAGAAVSVASGVSLYTGGTVDDVTVLTGATQTAATISGAGSNIATLSLPVPTTRTPLRMTINSVVVSVGTISPTTIGGTPTTSATITLAASTATVTVIGSVSSGGGGGSGTVTQVTGTAPIAVATGTTTPVVSIAAATTIVPGSMSAADKTKLDGIAAGAQPGTVTNVSGTAPIVSSGGTTPTISVTTGTTTGTVAAGDDSRITGAAPKASPTFTGTTTAPYYVASGLTGATAASRYVGATASGAPVSGTFAVGDFVIDQTGKVYVCTVLGTPGTWTLAGDGATGSAGGDLTGTYPNPTIGTGKVTSTAILDGTIVAGDINASAAIALSQLATQAATTLVGNSTGGAAVPTALSAASAKTLLAIASSDVSGFDTQVATTAALKASGGKETVNTQSTATGATTLNLANGNVFDLILTGNVTFTFSGSTASVACSFTLIAAQDGTGSRTITWPASVKWEGGTAPTISTVASRVDTFSFLTVDNGTTWRCIGYAIGVR